MNRKDIFEITGLAELEEIKESDIGDKMKYIAFYIVFILGLFLFYDIIQLIVRIKHAPYIQYPYKGAKFVIVYFYELSRTGKGSYSEYKYKCIDGKWIYIVNKDNIFATVVVYIILLVGILVSIWSHGLPSRSFGTNAFFTVTIMTVITAIYFPIRGYVLLMKLIHKTS